MATRKWLSAVRLLSAAADPSGGGAGELYYNSSTGLKTYSGSAWENASPRIPAVFSRTGNVTVATGAHRFYVEYPATILGVRVSVGTAPTGAALLVDVNKNGTTIFTTQGNRPSVAISGFASSFVTNMDVTSLAAGDYLTVDVDQVGSTIAGADMVATVWMRLL